MRVFYRVNGSEYDVELRSDPAWRTLDLRDGRDRRRAAEACANDFHYAGPGLDCEWPIRMELLDGRGGSVLARFEIEREAVPSFSATEEEEG